MSVAFIESFDRWFLCLSKGSGTTRRNDCYTKCGGFDKLNHRNANLLDSPYYIKAFECCAGLHSKWLSHVKKNLCKSVSICGQNKNLTVKFKVGGENENSGITEHSAK